MLADSEPFDRGYYAGPFGWVSGTSAEFAVAIRSVLVRPQQQQQQLQLQQQQAQAPSGSAAATGAAAASATVPGHSVFLYAGVGVVKGSDPESEWQELALKCRQ